jgi:hypothetical protein
MSAQPPQPILFRSILITTGMRYVLRWFDSAGTRQEPQTAPYSVAVLTARSDARGQICGCIRGLEKRTLAAILSQVTTSIGRLALVP